MQERSTLKETTPILIAIFFLVVPVAVLLAIDFRHKTPEEDYAKAIVAAMRPLPARVSHSLVSVDASRPLTVVTWTRQKQVADYQKGQTPTYKSVWVTVVPNLKSFCREFVRSRGADPAQLTQRLEQRLGLPPHSGYDTFVELKIEPDQVKDVTKFFRPCGNPSVTGNSCEPAFPPQPDQVRASLGSPIDPGDNNKIEAYWVLSKYYWSFAVPEKDQPMLQYPWTSLGYTFDWAPGGNGGDQFVRWGESEFVIAPGTPAQFISATNSAAYCAL
jgi:hypothetical protein